MGAVSGGTQTRRCHDPMVSRRPSSFCSVVVGAMWFRFMDLPRRDSFISVLFAGGSICGSESERSKASARGGS